MQLKAFVLALSFLVLASCPAGAQFDPFLAETEGGGTMASELRDIETDSAEESPVGSSLVERQAFEARMKNQSRSRYSETVEKLLRQSQDDRPALAEKWQQFDNISDPDAEYYYKERPPTMGEVVSAPPPARGSFSTSLSDIESQLGSIGRPPTSIESELQRIKPSEPRESNPSRSGMY